MKVILLTEVQGKGGEGDVVEVARGFFNNYLGPQKKAVLATAGNLKQLEQRRGNIAKREEKRIADAEALKASLEGKKIFVDAKVGDEGVLFGSMIADAVLAETGVEIDRKRLDVRKAIKTAGEHTVALNIYRDIHVDLQLMVGVKAVEEVEEAVVEAEAVETEATEEAAE